MSLQWAHYYFSDLIINYSPLIQSHRPPCWRSNFPHLKVFSCCYFCWESPTHRSLRGSWCHQLQFSAGMSPPQGRPSLMALGRRRAQLPQPSPYSAIVWQPQGWLHNHLWVPEQNGNAKPFSQKLLRISRW